MALNIQKQRAKNLRNLAVAQTGSWLKANPEIPDEEKLSIKVVNKKLLIKHCSLILWCAENRGVLLHVHNLHDVIANYAQQLDLYNLTQEAKEAQVLDPNIEIIHVMEPEDPNYFKEGTIRPDDFQAYFGRGDS